MATHYRGTGQPPEKAPTPQEQDPDAPSEYYHEVIDNFENVELETHTILKPWPEN